MPSFVVEPSAASYERSKKSRVILTNHGDYHGIEEPEEWDYEPEPEESYDAERIFSGRTDLINLTPSMFTEAAIRMPNKAEQRFDPFSFEGRRYMRHIYDTPGKKVLLKFGRQSEKSTLLGNKALAYCCINVAFNVLYVTPTNIQTKVFSNDRLKEPIETSEILKSWTTTKLSDNVFLKKFINRSQITLRYAYLNADRCRGVAGIDLLLLDEIQDILTDNIPVIEQTAAHGHFKMFSYSGTPKSLDNTLEHWWLEQSTQNEWAIPCHRHSISVPGAGGKATQSNVYYNILGEEHIGRGGLICDRCGGSISARDEEAMWVSLNPSIYKRLNNPFEGYHVPQIMVPLDNWEEILDHRKTYSTARFYNEVLGLSYDSGTRPLTRQDLIDNCNPNFLLTADFLKRLRGAVGDNQIYAGIDWGTGENTYTVMVLGAYLAGRFTFFYFHRFEGPESDPKVQLDMIEKIISGWRINLIGCDYGGGFDRNDELMKRFGWQRIVKYQYSTPGTKVRWEDGLKRFVVHRTEVMSDFFNAIKRRNAFYFPHWDHFHDPYANDFLNIFSEYSETRRMNEYKKAPKTTDDSYHAALLCFLASMLRHPRPDIIAPNSATGIEARSASKANEDS